MLSIDSHCHLQFPQYNQDQNKVIEKTLNENIGMICVGTDLEMSKKAIELADKYDGIWASVGIHPNDVEENFFIDDYLDSINHPKVIAIGEVGLDYYRTKETQKRVLQKQIFSLFLNLAKEKNFPLILHCREAYKDMLEMLRGHSGLKGVVHSFTSDLDTAQKFFDLGFYIGLNGIITFTEQYNDTVKNAPLDRILLETDAPFLAPVPHRGKRNEPAYVKFVAEQIAKVRGITVEEINKTILENTKTLFKI